MELHDRAEPAGGGFGLTGSRGAGTAAHAAGPDGAGTAAHAASPDGAGTALRATGPRAALTAARPAVAPSVPAGTRAPQRPAIERIARSRTGRQAILIAAYLTAGVALTWPRVTYLAGRLPAIRDTGGYVWDFWWVAHQVTHLSNPWYTTSIAAPVGTDLAFHTLMPLPGLLMTPVTLLFGPSASDNLLSIACPGLLCYAMYRAARLWLPGFGAVAAGACFGLSSSLAWRSWYELNLALGTLFLPMALAAAVRLRREPGHRRALALGAVLGCALLTDQESAVLATILAAFALLPWLLAGPTWAKARGAALSAGAAAVVASPQIAVMAKQMLTGDATTPLNILARNYDGSGASLAQLFAPSPRLAGYGLKVLAAPYYAGRPSLVVVGYGTVLSALATTGLIAAWRRPAARLLGLLWLACSLLALGSLPWLFDRGYAPLAQVWHGVVMSRLMPYTWFVRLPGMANFREADRLAILGLVPAALLAGAGVVWLRNRSKTVLVVALTLGLLEAGWSGNPAGHLLVRTMPTALPALDGPIAADHSHSIVVDVPFGIRGGLPVIGAAFPPETQVLATADGHPLADAWISRIPHDTLAGIARQPFYAALLDAQGARETSNPALLHAAGESARALNVGWVVVWQSSPAILRLLHSTGFHLAYRAGGALVYRLGGRLAAPARRGLRAGEGGGIEQPFRGQGPDQPAQPGREARPLPGGQRGEDPGLP